MEDLIATVVGIRIKVSPTNNAVFTHRISYYSYVWNSVWN